jgi:hypothetical protein
MDQEKVELSRPVSTVSGLRLEGKAELEDHKVDAGELTLDEGALSLLVVFSMQT